MGINKRNFLGLVCAALGVHSLDASLAYATPQHEIVIDGVSFRWQFQDGRLVGELSAPTAGWIAVGFNTEAGIVGTYFLMASVAHGVPKFEEHYATRPQHVRTAELGWLETARLHSGDYRDNVSSATFSISMIDPSSPRVALQPGEQIHLMLAWSHETDFDHHSAWREHAVITL